MNPEVRLAEIITALEAVGLACLVMGGHAVRFYGLDLRSYSPRWRRKVAADAARRTGPPTKKCATGA